MKIKTLIILIISCVFIGIVIFFAEAFSSKSSLSSSLVSSVNILNKKSSPSPYPKPTPPPLTKDSNLEEEMNKLNLKDYSQDFEDLKNSVKN